MSHDWWETIPTEGELGCGASIYNPDKSEREIIECDISITTQAKEELRKIMTDTLKYLYLNILGGGCSGHLYDLDLNEHEPTDLHQVIIDEDITLIINKLDSSLLYGLIIDYSTKLMGGGFTITNPNATKTCGCGLSFR